MDPMDFFLAVISGLLSSILIVYYVNSETERNRINNSINYLFDEIKFNRNKLPKYLEYLNDVKRVWNESGNTNLKWIDHNEVSTGYGGFLYNFFRFDGFYNFLSSGSNLYLDPLLDGQIKVFYHYCKVFCARTQQSENRMRKEFAERGDSVIQEGFVEIEREYKKISILFEDNPSISGDMKDKYQICWIQWHIERKRRIP